MFAFLPPSIGTVRQPGRREGKWLQMEYVSDLRSNGISLATWSHTARNSLHWRQTVFQSAPFLHPHWPRRGREPPVSRPSRISSQKPKKLSFVERVDQCAAELLHLKEDNSWIRLETQLGGRTKVHENLTQCFTQKFGQEWYTHPEDEVAEYLLDVPPWVNAQETVEDCVIARLTIRSLVHKHVLGLTDVKQPAWRLLGKRPAEQLHQPPPERVVPPPAEPPRVTGVRITKKFEHRFRVHETGNFPCTLCNRLFTTGTALATHVRSQHREGTFREHGFACPCCPRVFVIQSAHTWHTQNDHKAGSSALTCPHCQAVFPGKPILLLHMAQEHPLTSFHFPGPCPLCQQLGCEPVPHMKTELNFKRHRSTHTFAWPTSQSLPFGAPFQPYDPQAF